MSRPDKLFRAIVVMGAAITAPACDSGTPQAPPPGVPAPGDAAAAPADVSPAPDASGDAIAAPRDAAPRDAMVAIDARKRADAGVNAADTVEQVLIL